MGIILLSQGDLAGAEEHFANVLISVPGDLTVRDQLAQVLWKQGKFREAAEQYKQLLEREPANLDAWLAVARLLISDPRPDARFGDEARQIAQHVCEATGNQNIVALQMLAAAYAETGDFARAEAIVRQALQTSQGQQPSNALVLQQSLEFYRAHRETDYQGTIAAGINRCRIRPQRTTPPAARRTSVEGSGTMVIMPSTSVEVTGVMPS